MSKRTDIKSRIQFTLCLLAGLMFINAGLDKFFHHMPMPKDMPEKTVRMTAAFAEIGWLLPLVGAIEIIGGVLLIFNRTRPLGAVVILPILAGIPRANINVAPSGWPIIFVLIVIIAWVMIENREKYLPIMRK